jgi:hypothetical protein
MGSDIFRAGGGAGEDFQMVTVHQEIVLEKQAHQTPKKVEVEGGAAERLTSPTVEEPKEEEMLLDSLR